MLMQKLLIVVKSIAEGAARGSKHEFIVAMAHDVFKNITSHARAEEERPIHAVCAYSKEDDHS